MPESFDRYSAADQQRIWRRMQVVQEAERQGVDLEEGPFPIPEEEDSISE